MHECFNYAIQKLSGKERPISTAETEKVVDYVEGLFKDGGWNTLTESL